MFCFNLSVAQGLNLKKSRMDRREKTSMILIGFLKKVLPASPSTTGSECQNQFSCLLAQVCMRMIAPRLLHATGKGYRCGARGYQLHRLRRRQ